MHTWLWKESSFQQLQIERINLILTDRYIDNSCKINDQSHVLVTGV